MSELSVTVGILSIGEMGLGIAKLLIAHNYRVVTNHEGRSEDTKSRAATASIQDLGSDTSLVSECDYILSIVPPRDALTTAQRITTAFNAISPPKTTPLYYLDLNAISPRSARSIATLFTTIPPITFLDGGLIGGAPRPKTSSIPSTNTILTQSPGSGGWSKPSIPISGPLPNLLPASWTGLREVLGLNHISEDVGTASGLKCCFATTTKGFTALCIQAFTTAGNLGVLPLLVREMEERAPGMLRSARGGVVSMAPKAYRWVREMEEISQTHSEEGNFSSSTESRDTSHGIFHEIAELYRTVAEDTVLGEEKTDKRKRGLDVEDVAAAMGEGLKEKAKRARKE
ncbi:hypothetical protein HYALB_00002774 [Hymenoscyphus albidus]|uniref:6-phosphogluconate dehydrogenase C-terminal domain-like protein n=1 Tax=Hymenoscyphus albidus TaxID=595503 RepID=A0A9N9LKD7_9HELO|nr:hypothetical protein HYALB_00002774 [Hymenoscyphus albidus]